MHIYQVDGSSVESEAPTKRGWTDPHDPLHTSAYDPPYAPRTSAYAPADAPAKQGHLSAYDAHTDSQQGHPSAFDAAYAPHANDGYGQQQGQDEYGQEVLSLSLSLSFSLSLSLYLSPSLLLFVSRAISLTRALYVFLQLFRCLHF